MSYCTYPPEEYYSYEAQQPYDYRYSTSPSSTNAGSYPMTTDNSTQSMSSTSSYTESPSTYTWPGSQQAYDPTYTISPSQTYLTPQETPRYAPQVPYQQAQQQPQESPQAQRGSEPQHKQYICLEPGCETKARFKRAADLDRHQNTVHLALKHYPCPRPRCNRKGDAAFTRKDHLIEHLRNKHGVDIPKGGRGRK
ncbi:hypothetical protein MMC16_001921 [Acarospora aff. strigata]|nr:hypothetical protein [Acarospora aff. strigata]